MDNRNIKEHLDELLRASRLEEAERFMLGTLKEARDQEDVPVQLFILSELAGFYRDCGRFEESVKSAEICREYFDREGIKEGEDFISMELNLANAYRAAGRRKDAHRVYDEVYPVIRPFSEKYCPAYYNNLALLYEDEGDLRSAADAFRSAIGCLSRSDPDYERRLAITRANLSSVQTLLGEDGEENAKLSLEYFKGLSPSDFHYSAALSAMGDVLLSKGDTKKAALFFEAALSEMLLHMGECPFCDTVREKIGLCRRGEQTERVTGLTLSRMYYEMFGKPMLKRNFPDETKYLACGLCGEGSECFGFDDLQSEDHDFGPSFCIFVSDNAPEGLQERLKKAYSLLPPVFMGKRHTESPNTSGRRGVMTVSDFYRRVLGCIPETAEDFQSVPDDRLAAAVNGEIYFDYCGEFSAIRRRIIHRPLADRLAKLAAELEMMSKCGEYNLPRITARGDRAAALVCRAQFLLACARAYHLCENKLAPYEKWIFESLRRLSPEFARSLEENALLSDDHGKVIELVKDRILSSGLLKEREPLAVMAERLTERARQVNTADKIASLEWQLFDKVQNRGGRADCQDDPYTFFHMRRSQYYSYDTELLESIYRDFRTAAESGRNVITEKYGYMMESTFPEEFREIQGSLPEVDDEKKKLAEAIIPIQVGMMEDFAKEEPDTALRARPIHTWEDSPAQTSYETYLRGELYTYSTDTLALYGAFIVRLVREGRNLAREIIEKEKGPLL